MSAIDAARRTFERLAAASWNDIAGVVMIEGPVPGPCLAITVCTHGNEPSGLAAIAHVLALGDAGWRPRHGRVALVANNLEAASRYFSAGDEAAKLAARFVDCDMNRLPLDAMSSSTGASEIRRAQALAPVWSQFDAAMDIHSVGQESEPMIVEGAGDARLYTRGFPITKVLRGIADVQIGVPAFGFYGGERRCVTFEIEAGWHETPLAFELAIACTESFLRAGGMLDGEVGAGPEFREIYDVCGALKFPDQSYVLTQVFPTFHPVRAGDVLATGSGPGRGVGAALAAPIDGHVIFAPKKRVPPNPTGEVLFFTRPVRIERA